MTWLIVKSIGSLSDRSAIACYSFTEQGIKEANNVLVVGMTNRPELIDPGKIVIETKALL